MQFMFDRSKKKKKKLGSIDFHGPKIFYIYFYGPNFFSDRKTQLTLKLV